MTKKIKPVGKKTEKSILSVYKGFGPQYSNMYNMESNGFFCGFNMPKALNSVMNGNEEIEHDLPPYNTRQAFLVDKYPACPNNWLRSEGKTTSYFVAVEEGYGMWLDFNKNENHTHHLAIVVSIQGINPITGLPCNDNKLEQYIDKCPKHNTKFNANRFCEKCGFKWPKQNYISTTGNPMGSLWLDGFRAADGVVRQYILTKEKMRGVASNIIGNDRVFAVGISFFLSKSQKPIQQQHITRNIVYKYADDSDCWNVINTCDSAFSSSSSDSFACSKSSSSKSSSSSGLLKKASYVASSALYLCKVTDDLSPAPIAEVGAAEEANEIEDYMGVISENLTKGSPNFLRSANSKQASNIQKVSIKKLEVGAGAKISQRIFDDPEPLDFWRDEPEAIICINYCSEKELLDIINQGEIDVEGSKEAYLENIPVGN